MSDFLQFVDRVPTLPNRKKITHADSSVEYATVEYADEPIATGTPLNRATLQKINRIMGYEKISGIYNPTAETAEYTSNYFNASEVIDNMRLLVQAINKPQGPADKFTIIKPYSSIDTKFDNVNSINMSNGNILIVGGSGNYTILDNNGNTIKAKSSLGTFSYIQPIEMSNGNIMLAGSYSGSTYVSIIDSGGNVVKSLTQISNNFTKPQLLEMNNGNIIIAGNSSNTGYFTILDQNGNVIKSTTSIGTFFGNLQMCEVGNNIIIVGDNSGSYYCFYCIVSNSGTIIKTSSTTNVSNWSNKVTTMQNGNAVIVGTGYQSNSKACIIDSSGNIVNTTDLGISISDVSLLSLSNENVMIIGYVNYDTYIKIIDINGNILFSKKITSESFHNSKIIEMTNGNIMVAYVNSANYGFMSILDKEGNFIYQSTLSTSSDMSAPQLLEMNNGNIMFVCVGPSSNYYAYRVVVEPISTNLVSKLNGIDLDTMLQKDKYYELVYNETLDKFISEEVRNAN